MNTVAAVADPETVKIITPAAGHRIGTGTTREGIGPVIKADQIVIAGTAGEHPVDDRFQVEDCAVGEFEALDAMGSEAIDHGDDIDAVAEVDDQVIAVA